MDPVHCRNAVAEHLVPTYTKSCESDRFFEGDQWRTPFHSIADQHMEFTLCWQCGSIASGWRTVVLKFCFATHSVSVLSHFAITKFSQQRISLSPLISLLRSLTHVDSIHGADAANVWYILGIFSSTSSEPRFCNCAFFNAMFYNDSLVVIATLHLHYQWDEPAKYGGWKGDI